MLDYILSMVIRFKPGMQPIEPEWVRQHTVIRIEAMLRVDSVRHDSIVPLCPSIEPDPVQLTANVSEAVYHPGHYGGDTTYETIKVLRAWLSPAEYQGFCKGNAIKYLSRAGKKHPDAQQDLAKAQWYCREAGLPLPPNDHQAD